MWWGRGGGCLGTGWQANAWPTHSCVAGLQAGAEVWRDICSGAAERQPSLLCRFVLLAHGDLKAFHFHYWWVGAAACLPACLPACTHGEAPTMQHAACVTTH